MTAAVDDLVPRAEVLRPGLLVLPVRGAARYFGSEQAAAERLVDAVAAAGAECQVGIADRLPTAVFAARAGRIVEPGKDAVFLSALSIRQLATEPSLAAPGREDLADLLWRMGIRNIGQFAALSRSRCGLPVRGRRGRRASLRPRRAEPRAVGARTAAGTRRGDGLRPADRPGRCRGVRRPITGQRPASQPRGDGVGCTRLAIHAVTANGEELNRVWRCAEPLTEDATADRVRWQLDGWLNRRNPNDRPTAPVTVLRLHPVEVVSAEALQLPLWGGIGEEDRLRARRALVRVQGLLGPEAVQVPVLSGGRGPAERITFTPLGDEPVPRADPGQPWPGQLPEPSPTVLLDDPVEVLDGEGNPVRVTGRGCSPPTRRGWPRLAGTAGCPGGPDHGRSTSGGGIPTVKAGRTARAQVLLDGRPRAGAAAVLPPAAVVPRRHLRIGATADRVPEKLRPGGSS